MKIQNKNVDKIFRLFDSYGYECYLVGGCVRDMIMYTEPHDYDFCTNATPEQMKEICESTGYEYYTMGEKYGTITIRIDADMFECTTYRFDAEYSDGRRPDKVIFSDNLKDDIVRRDFTVNAMAINQYGDLIDLVNGKKDCADCIIRCVGNPEERFREDGLRILRAVRFAIKCGFEVEGNTLQAMIDNIDMLDHIATERIWNELDIILHQKEAERLLDEFRFVFKKILDICGIDSNKYHYSSAYGMLSRYNASNESYNPVSICCLFHDEHSEDMEKFLVAMHQNGMINDCREIHSMKAISIPIDGYATRYIRYMMINHSVFILHKTVKYWKLFKPVEQFINIDKFDRKIEEIMFSDIPLCVKDLNINGNDLQKVGIYGKNIGIALNCVLYRVVNDDIKNNKEDILDYILKYHSDLIEERE